MKRSILISSIILLCTLSTQLQAQEVTESNDTWYVWIDVEVPLDGKMVKVVSKEPMIITCCPKSSKYRKFVKKTAKWITENISASYSGELSLMKIQDKDLAYETVSQLQTLEGVTVIDYQASCK